MNDRPLISMVLSSYRQKEFVLPALEALFKQTYSPLEIVVSDDCSLDGSYEALEEMVERYRSTPSSRAKHKIILLSNVRNVGNAKNFERAYRAASGELIINCDGDDISYPNRAEAIAEKWLTADKKPTLIFHGSRAVSLDGKPLASSPWRQSLRHPLGAAMAFSPCVVRNYSPIVVDGCYQDNVFTRRAYAYGEPLYIEDVLVDYRVGSGDTTKADFRTNRQRIAYAMMNSARQNLLDLKEMRGGGGKKPTKLRR